MSTWNVTNGRFKNFDFHLAIPAGPTELNTYANAAYGMTSQNITDERRLQISEKPLVDGAVVEDFGRKPRTFSAEVIFFGPDYLPRLKEFEAILHQGTSGVLILPDLSEAVNAKFQKLSRKSSATDGNATMLSVQWIEDISKDRLTNTLRTPSEALDSLLNNDFNAAKPDIDQQISTVKANAALAASALSGNALLNAINAAENAVTTTRVTINSVLNVPRNIRQNVISNALRMANEISGLQSSLIGIQAYLDSLKVSLSSGTPTRYNTGAGQVDFKSVDTVSTAVVGGSQQVVTTVKTPAISPISSLPQAVQKLQASVAAISAGKTALESQTQGSTKDFSKSSVQLVNSVLDLILIISAPATRQVVTTSQTSVIEICFENGLTINDIQKVQAKNTFLGDILDVPRFTVINL